MLKNKIQALITELSLPTEFLTTVNEHYGLLADDIVRNYRNSADYIESRDVTLNYAELSGVYVVGVQGCQGSGKSTLAEFLKLILKEKYQLKSAVLSMDDFYHDLATRQTLSAVVHPLFVTRGVPGTHDVPLALQAINALKAANTKTHTLIPRFNKATDDRFEESEWQSIVGRPNIIILEGWCLGVEPQSTDELNEPVNALEESEDADGAWRKAVNNAIEQEYLELNSLVDYLAVLQVPSFDCVLQWRSLQERKLRNKLLVDKDSRAAKLMSESELQRFVAHFQRLTEHCARTLPEKANRVYTLDANQRIESL